MDVGQALAYHARHRPDQLALVCEDRSLTWYEFNERADQVANAFRTVGVTRGDRILLLIDNSLEFVLTVYGLGKIGCVSVPVKPGSVSREVTEIADSVEPRVVVGDADSAQVVSDIDESHSGSITTVGVGRDHGLSLDFDSIVDAASTVAPASDVSGEDPFLILYTGGTTGNPKGCIRTHSSYVMAALIRLVEVPLEDDDRGLIATPLATGFAFGILNKCLFRGVTQVLLREFDPDAYFDAIEQRKVTLAYAIMERMGMRLVSHDRFDHVDFSSLRLFRALIPTHQLERFHRQESFEAGFTTIYGSTETGVVAIKKPARFEQELTDPDPERYRGSVGKEVLLSRITCLDENQTPVDGGEIGEIAVQGPSVCEGYWNQPDETADAFRDGWLLTGDLGVIDESGYLHLVGRKDGMIQTGGLNVYPVEVESVLQAHDDVAEAAVIGLPHPEWGEMVVACIVPTGSCDEDSLNAHLETQLASYKHPKRIVFVDSLPRNESGKVLKRELEASLSESTDSDR